MIAVLKRARHWLEPPIFPGNEEKSAQAQVMNSMGVYFLVTLLITAVVFVPLFAKRQIESWAILLVLFILYCIARFLMFRGHLVFAGMFMVASGWVLCIGLALVGGGMSSPMMVVAVTFTIIIGLLFREHIGNAFLVISLAGGLWVAIFQQNGGVLPQFFSYTPLSIWFFISLALVFMNRTMNLVIGRLENALVLARQQNEARQKAEAALQESERAHRALVQTLAVGVVVHAPDTHIVLANDCAAKLLGLSIDQMMGKEVIDPAWRFLSKDGSPMQLEDYPVMKVLATRAPMIDKVGGIAHLGTQELIWVLVNAFPEFDREGGLRQIVVTLVDITERKRAEEKLEENRRFLADLFEYSATAIFVKDVHGRYEMVNRKFEEELDLQRHSVIGRTDAEYRPSHIAAQYQATDLSVIESGQPLEIEDFVDGPRGRQHYLTLKFPLRAADSSIRGVCGMTTNITERKLAEEALREQRALAEALSDSAAALNSTLNFDNVLDRILDNVGRVAPHDAVGVLLLDAARQIAQIVGYRDLRDSPEDMKGDQFLVSQTRNLREMQASGDPVIIADTRAYDGWLATPLNAWIRASLGVPIRIKGEIIGFLCLASATPNAFTPQDAKRLQAFVDHAAIAIENARLYEEVQKLALIDKLTGSFNRSFFETELARMELGRDFPVSIVIVDLDNMKITNDGKGHPAGDELLRRTVQVLQAAFRSADVIARIGGDEFAVLLPNTDAATAAQMLSRIHLKLAEHNAQYPELPIQLSLGTATAEQGGLIQAFTLADHRMYADKAVRKSKSV